MFRQPAVLSRAIPRDRPVLFLPLRLILARLRKKRYTGHDLFRNSAEAIRAYRIRTAFRKRFHGERLAHDFSVDNHKPLNPQINRIIKRIKGL